MENDHDGIISDSRNRQYEQPSKNAEEIKTSHGESSNSSDGGNLTNGCESEKQPEEIVAALSEVGITSSWSGLLPHPEQFSKYEKEVQRKMLDWNDAMILDESKRQDKIVDAEIKQSRLSSFLNFIFNTIVIVAVFVAFVITENPNVFWAFTVQGASLVANVVIHIKDKDDNEKGE